MISIVALIVTGCSNIAEKRTELAAAGFRTIPATTPEQLARIASLKSAKIIPINGPKGTIYVFADHQRKALMIGSPEQYKQYRAIKIHQQKIDAQLLDAQLNMDNSEWATWGPYAGWGWSVASEPL